MNPNLDRGILLLRQAAKLKPDDPKICMDLIAAYCTNNQTLEAAKEFITYIRNSNEATQLHHDMLLKTGCWNDLLKGFNHLEQDNAFKDTFLLRYARGLLFTTKGCYDEAIPDFKEAINLNPEYAATYHNLGLAYYYSCKFISDPKEKIVLKNKAIDACKTATRKSRTIAEPYFFLGEMEMDGGDILKAFLYLTEFVKLASPYLLSYVNMAQLEIQLLRQKMNEAD